MASSGVRPVEAGSERDQIVELIPALRAFARTFCRDLERADDLVQDTLTKAIGNFHQFTPGTRLKSWLFTIMRNTFYSQIKKISRETVGEADCVASTPSVVATQEWSCRRTELKAALGRLPEHHREVIMLIGVLGESYEEAARVCGCEVGTVKSRLSRARARLAFELGEQSDRAIFEDDEFRSKLV